MSDITDRIVNWAKVTKNNNIFYLTEGGRGKLRLNGSIFVLCQETDFFHPKLVRAISL